MKRYVFVLAAAVSTGAWAAELRQVMIVSRHNLRAPLSTSIHMLEEMTTNTWFAWTSRPGELSRKGAALETAMGGWFRDWLVDLGLFGQKEVLRPDQVRFLSNNIQRTIATARCFAAGFMPEADVVVEHEPFTGSRDPRFSINVPHCDEALSNRIFRQVAEKFDGAAGLDHSLAPNYALLGRVIDYPSSIRGRRPGAAPFASVGVSSFDIVRKPDTLGLHGPIGDAYPVADALILHLYESAPGSAVFGHMLSWDDLRRIADIKEGYISLRYRTKAMSATLGARLLHEFGEILRRDGPRLSFIGGHDTTLAWVGTQLDVEPYDLHGALERHTPIGSKIVFGRWRCEDGLDRVSVDFVYQTMEQIRAGQVADRAHPPCIVRLCLKGLSPDAEGRYLLADVLPRLLTPDSGS